MKPNKYLWFYTMKKDDVTIVLSEVQIPQDARMNVLKAYAASGYDVYEERRQVPQ